MDIAKDAADRMRAGYNCPQSVLTAFAEAYDLPLELAARIATAFGGGMGRNNEVCGAVSGALMVLGLKFGNSIPGDVKAKEYTYRLANRFQKRFAELNGSTHCTQLTGYNLEIPDQLQQARQAGVFNTRCPQIVESSARLLLEILAEEDAG